MSVAIVSDSTHYLPAEALAGHELHTVPLWLVEDGRATREDLIGDWTELYRALRAGERSLSTSQPSVGEFLELYEPLLAAGRDIVSVHLTQGMSGTVETARQAREEAIGKYPDRTIEIVDSGSTAGGLALVVVAAIRAAEAGGDAAAVVAAATETANTMQIRFGLDTLEYLRRGGRVGRAQGLLGSTLQIRPILKLDGGAGSVNETVEKIRTSSKMRLRLLKFMEEFAEQGHDSWAVMHIMVPDVVEEFLEAGRKVFGTDPVFICEAGPVVGAHTGPGMIGIGAASSTLVGSGSFGR
ncbi:MAG: DegV family protein [Solirubrobacteraceae bacterium]|nr:DegV family protein [Solirubrobacteraceae bacterium]